MSSSKLLSWFTPAVSFDSLVYRCVPYKTLTFQTSPLPLCEKALQGKDALLGRGLNVVPKYLHQNYHVSYFVIRGNLTVHSRDLLQDSQSWIIICRCLGLKTATGAAALQEYSTSTLVVRKSMVDPEKRNCAAGVALCWVSHTTHPDPEKNSEGTFGQLAWRESPAAAVSKKLSALITHTSIQLLHCYKPQDGPPKWSEFSLALPIVSVEV